MHCTHCIVSEQHFLLSDHVSLTYLDIAIRPIYNLYTFLEAVKSSHLSDLSPTVAGNVIHTQARMFDLANSMPSGLFTLGPITWDQTMSGYYSSSIIHRGIGRYDGNGSKDGSKLALVNVARSIAKASLVKEKKAEELINASSEAMVIECLAAYHLLTAFGEDFASVSKIVTLPNVAEDILWIARELELPLHERQLRVLEMGGEIKVNRLNYKKPVDFRKLRPPVQIELESVPETTSDIDEGTVEDSVEQTDLDSTLFGSSKFKSYFNVDDLDLEEHLLAERDELSKKKAEIEE